MTAVTARHFTPLAPDVFPNVHLGPVTERKHAHVFTGKQGPVREAILLNAAIAIAAFKADFSSGVTEQIANGYVLAKQALESGKAFDLLESWGKYTQELSPANQPI